jgi:hypothetical protein
MALLPMSLQKRNAFVGQLDSLFKIFHVVVNAVLIIVPNHTINVNKALGPEWLPFIEV